MKKGFTLIEVVVVLAISLIILTVGMIGIKTLNKVSNSLKENEGYYEILDTLCYARKYSVQHNTSGEINIKSLEGKIKLKFLVDCKEIKTTDVDSKVKIFTKDYKERINEKAIYVNKDGFLTPTTICFLNDNNEKKEITIGVGGNHVSFKIWQEGKWRNIT